MLTSFEMLIQAAGVGDTVHVQSLMKESFEPRIAQEAIEQAIAGGHRDVVTLMLPHVSLPQPDCLWLRTAACRGDVPMVTLLREVCDPLPEDDAGLQRALLAGNLDEVKAFIAASESPHQHDTSLVLAVRYKRQDMVEALLAARAPGCECAKDELLTTVITEGNRSIFHLVAPVASAQAYKKALFKAIERFSTSWIALLLPGLTSDQLGQGLMQAAIRSNGPALELLMAGASDGSAPADAAAALIFREDWPAVDRLSQWASLGQAAAWWAEVPDKVKSRTTHLPHLRNLARSATRQAQLNEISVTRPVRPRPRG